MNIIFDSSRLERVCNSGAALNRKYGQRKAKKIQQRLFELQAADSLSDISHLPPPRCHALIGNRQGQFSVDTVHPYRIIFEPANDPVPLQEDGSLDKSQVTAVRILDVNVDTHE
ncbi:MAG TPA: hypothetical protein P5280_18375 [Cyclobacteriaceae bacterium]|nr:hypothetical protein [Cyclobacteriaceae bacterium]